MTAGLVKGVSDRLLSGADRVAALLAPLIPSAIGKIIATQIDMTSVAKTQSYAPSKYCVKGNITSCPPVAAPVISPTQVVRTRSGDLTDDTCHQGHAAGTKPEAGEYSAADEERFWRCRL